MDSRKVDAKGIYILLVEGDETVSVMVERCFHEGSRRSDIVTHLLGSEESPFDEDVLLDELRRRPYDCVLMDVTLPGGNDGITQVQAVRQRLASAPPIILLTANVSAAMRVRAIAAGAAELIDKNDLTRESLRAVVDVAVRRQLSSGGAH